MNIIDPQGRESQALWTGQHIVQRLVDLLLQRCEFDPDAPHRKVSP